MSFDSDSIAAYYYDGMMLDDMNKDLETIDNGDELCGAPDPDGYGWCRYKWDHEGPCEGDE